MMAAPASDLALFMDLTMDHWLLLMSYFSTLLNLWVWLFPPIA